ncbi:MAG: CDP-alcohol phosphatidyltransferase family protein [Deltaproteobacteria bacterium]|nr:CDP-alcohol phosphatidyltransferase family protein [Deltaproteobacteria bacterium]
MSRLLGQRYARSDLTLANVFTVARLVMIPIFGFLWATRDDESALWVFVLAAATDLIDGFLARFLNQKSQLGALLDPLADKLLMVVSLLVGVHVGAVPSWLAVVVIGRDALLALGVVGLGVIWKGRHGPSSWQPTRIGKYAMFLQTVSIVSAIVEDILSPEGFRPYVQVIMVAAAILTMVAGAQYSIRAALALRRPRTDPLTSQEG